MRIPELKRLLATVQSISACTAPTVQVGKIRANGDRLNSPYSSHRLVEYQVVEEAGGATLVAWNNRSFLQVGGEPPDPYPLEGYVSEVKEAEVPSGLLEPVIKLCRTLGLYPKIPEELVKVYFFSRKLAGFHFGRPVFWMANGENSPLELEGEPKIQQGSLTLLEGEHLPEAPFWDPGKKFYNHTLSLVEGAEDDGSPAWPAALIYQGVPMAGLRVIGPGRIISKDHPPIEVPERRIFVAIHPLINFRLPREGMD